MQLIHLPPNPRNLTRKINLIAQNLSRGGIRPQRVQGAIDDAGACLLVVEDCEAGAEHDYGEERQGFEPFGGSGCDFGEGAVGAAFEEGAGVGFWCGDEGSSLGDAWFEDLSERGCGDARSKNHDGGWVDMRR